MSPKPFSWAKNQRNLFSDEKSRGTLLARAALKNRIRKLKKYVHVVTNQLELTVSKLSTSLVGPLAKT